MIKYEEEETKYNYNLSDVESILKYLSDNNYYDSKLCTKEVMQELMSYIRVVRKLKMWYNLSARYERRKLESSLYGVTLIHI